MDSRNLPKNFFKNNPLQPFSAAQFCHCKMTLGLEPEYDKALGAIFSKTIAADHRASIREEKEKIEWLCSAEEIVAFMRTRFDGINQNLLCQKALTMQETVIPLMLQRYRTTMQDMFIETAVMILSHAEMCHIKSLIEMYEQIRNPYAKSMACLVIGMRKAEGTIPMLLKEYEQMKLEYPADNLCQGPLLGLYVMHDMIWWSQSVPRHTIFISRKYAFRQLSHKCKYTILRPSVMPSAPLQELTGCVIITTQPPLATA